MAKPSAKKSTRKSSDKPQAKASADHGAAIAKSWKDKDVAAARNAKHKVKVGGVEYRSVLAAFEALGLPVSKHGAFRAELKAAPSGRKTFEGHAFTLVQP